MKLRKLMFVLPNLFTLTSIFCGFYALTLTAGDATPAHLYQAAIAVFFAMFFDGFDGRVARLTKTQSAFGVELDSLADVISFGVVPAMIIYKWALMPLGLIGTLIAFAFAACGALRLARFNVIAQRSPHGGASRFFVGLPIPLAGAALMSLIVAHYAATRDSLDLANSVPIAALVIVLALLMVSTVRYRTFKDLRPSRKSLMVFGLICVSGVVIARQFHPAYVMVAYFSAYLLFGLVESVFLLRTHLAERRATASGAPDLDEELDEDDEESAGQDYL